MLTDYFGDIDPPVSGHIDPPCAGIISEHTDPPANPACLQAGVKIAGFRTIVTQP